MCWANHLWVEQVYNDLAVHIHGISSLNCWLVEILFSRLVIAVAENKQGQQTEQRYTLLHLLLHI